MGEGSCRPGSADDCTCRLDGTRAQGVCGGRAGGVGSCRRSATSAARCRGEGSRESDWADKSGRFLGGGVRSKYALRKRWSDLKRKNRDSVGSARKKFSRKTHTFDVVGGRGWVKK